MAYILWPLVHVLLRCFGWKPFRLRPRRRWYMLPWYQRGVVVRPYPEVLWHLRSEGK